MDWPPGHHVTRLKEVEEQTVSKDPKQIYEKLSPILIMIWQAKHGYANSELCHWQRRAR